MLVLLLLFTSLLSIAVHIVDRATNHGSNAYAMTLWAALIQLGLLLPFAGFVSPLENHHLWLLFPVAWFSTYARSRWYQALAHSPDALSRLVPMGRLSSFMALLMAVFILGEDVPVPAFIGGLLMIMGALFISLERPAQTFSEFLRHNQALLLVLVFAASRAINNVSYKWILTGSAGAFFSLYFYLKMFELLTVGITILSRAKLRENITQIRGPRAFFGARVVQSVAGFLFMFVLAKVDLSKVEPIIACGPLMVLIWEGVDKRYRILRRLGVTPAPEREMTSSAWWLRIAGILMIIGGFIMLERWK